MTPFRNFRVGDLAVLKDNSLPPIKWHLVRPGTNGVVRVVTVRNAAGSEFQRRVVKIAPLPTDVDEDDK